MSYHAVMLTTLFLSSCLAHSGDKSPQIFSGPHAAQKCQAQETKYWAMLKERVSKALDLDSEALKSQRARVEHCYHGLTKDYLEKWTISCAHPVWRSKPF